MDSRKRREMLVILSGARAACWGDMELHDLGVQLGKAVDFLKLLVAGNRKSRWFEPHGGQRLFSPKQPLRARLELLEGEVREVYSDFECAVSAEKYDDKATMTLGDWMVLDAVDDALWMIVGMLDDLKEAEEKADGREGSEA